MLDEWVEQLKFANTRKGEEQDFKSFETILTNLEGFIEKRPALSII